MAAPAATSCPSTCRNPPSKVIRVGVSTPKHPRMLQAPIGAVTSAPRGMGRRGIKIRRWQPRS
eukprot:9885701-Lingulodinium_polyedra.AAC.1